MNTQEELKDWLTTQGFHECKNTWSGSDNRCDWYAVKRYGVEHLCETNSEKPGIQIVVWPYEYHFPQLENPGRSVEIEITGEANGIWYKLCAYSIPWTEAVERFDAITESLVVAWDSIPRREK